MNRRDVYQRLQAAANLLPRQTHMHTRLHDYVQRQIDTQFASSATSSTTTAGSQAAPATLWTAADADALTRIAEGRLEQQYGPSPQSKVVAFLPPEERFQLLGDDVQTDLASKSSMDYIVNMIQDKLGFTSSSSSSSSPKK